MDAYHVASPARQLPADVRHPQYQEIKAKIHRDLLNRLNLERLATARREDAEPEIRGLDPVDARRRDPDDAAHALRARDAGRRRAPRAVRPRAARSRCSRTRRSPTSWSTATTRSTSSARASSRRCRSRSRTTGTCCRSSSGSSARSAGASTSRARWWTPASQDGSRVNAIIPPLALDGPVLSIRRFRTDKLGAQDMVDRQTLTEPMLDFLKACVAARLNVIVSGGTGAGKTTFLNVLSGFISETGADRHDRGRRGTRAPAAARRPARDPAAEHRGQGRRAAAPAGDQRAAHAAGPDHRRRGPRRRGARHAAGDEHRPRRQPDDDPRQQRARRALPPRHDGGDGQPEHPRAGDPAAGRQRGGHRRSR